MKHGSEKRGLKLITCGLEKTFRTIWREEGLEDIFPTEQVEVEEMRRRQARKARPGKKRRGKRREMDEMSTRKRK